MARALADLAGLADLADLAGGTVPGAGDVAEALGMRRQRAAA
ncbi:hypothetical protein [Blastococcus deserti]|uniref:Uncharacterized protein n=1 Tax=Blastococcus deserti TaxID=2259033 RepID=A0ABW4X7A6_9ACTN